MRVYKCVHPFDKEQKELSICVRLKHDIFYFSISRLLFEQRHMCIYKLVQSKKKISKMNWIYGQKEKIYELCFLYVPTFVSVMNEVLWKVQPMINKQTLKRQKFCVWFLRCMLYFAHTKRFYIHIFTLTEYDSYKYQGY